MALKTLKEAVKNREKPGFRFDNSKYWKRYYSNKAKNKDFTREQEYINFLFKLLNKKAKILDIATGYGFLPVELSKLGLKVECVDKYSEMIEVASEYMKKNNFSLKIHKADAVALPMKANSYDLVTAQSIIEHFCFEEMSARLIPEINRVTKKGGLILIHVPIKSGVSVVKRFYRKNIKKICQNGRLMMMGTQPIKYGCGLRII